MINLIPNNEKKKMRRDFYFRFVAVLLFTSGCSLLLSIFALTPSYFLVTSREAIINDQIARQKNEPIPVASQQAVSVAEDLDKKVSLIESFNETDKFKVSEAIISEIILNKMPDIKLIQILYEITAKGEKRVVVRGNAPSRERLLLFRIALEDSLAFKKVDLPISSFVRGSNIEFSIDITP